MKLVQFILVPLVIIVVLTYFKRLRTKLFDRMIVLVLGTFGVLLVLFPDLAQMLAGNLGVGRGADLMMYFGLLGLVFSNILLFAKTRELEALMTNLTRKQAINTAERPSNE